MNGKQRAEIVTPAAVQKTFDTRRVDVKRKGIDIGEYRTGAGPHDGAGRSEEAEGRGENLIAGLHSNRCESQPQSVGAGGAADGMGRAAKVGEFPLQRLDLRPQNVM